MDLKINNKPSFGGKLIVGEYLSKNFDKSVSDLNKMLKDKPYDVTVNGIHKYKGKRKKIVTKFRTQAGYRYLVEFAPKTTHGSYKTALNKLIDRKDELVKEADDLNNKKLTFKEKAYNYLRKLYDELCDD